MTRADVIEAMADAIGAAEGSPDYDRGFDLKAAKKALEAVEALGVRLVPVIATGKMLSLYGAVTLTTKLNLWGEMLNASPLRPDMEG